MAHLLLCSYAILSRTHLADASLAYTPLSHTFLAYALWRTRSAFPLQSPIADLLMWQYTKALSQVLVHFVVFSFAVLQIMVRCF